MKSIFIIIFTLIISCNIQGQALLLTYEKAISLALESSITLKQQENQLKIEKTRTWQRYANLLPSVNLAVNGTNSIGRQFDNEAKDIVTKPVKRGDITLGINYWVFGGFNRLNSILQSTHNYNAQKYAVEREKQNIIFNVTQLFLQILLDKELMNIERENIETQKIVLEQISTLVELGIRAEADLYAQEAIVNTIEVQMTNRANRLEIDKANLSQLLQIPVNDSIDVAAPNWAIQESINAHYNLDSLYSLALQNRFDYKSLLEAEASSSNGLNITKAGFYPRLNVFYNHIGNYSSNTTKINSENSSYTIPLEEQVLRANTLQNYGFTLTIPIFNNYTVSSNVRIARFQLKNAGLNIKNAERTIFLDVQNSYLNYKSLCMAYSASLKSLKSATRAYETQKERFDLGEGSIVDLSVQNQQFNVAKADKTQLEYTLIFQKKIIDFFTGTLETNIQ
jgi:outer membrane protein